MEMTRVKSSPLGAPLALLDAWFWRRGIRHPLIRALLCHETAAAFLALLAGGALMAATPWLLWFGAGLACMAWIFWSWARFFSCVPGGGVQPGALFGALLRWVGRMLVFALALFWALRAGASPMALAAGVAAGVAVGFASYAINSRNAGM